MVVSKLKHCELDGASFVRQKRKQAAWSLQHLNQLINVYDQLPLEQMAVLPVAVVICGQVTDPIVTVVLAGASEGKPLKAHKPTVYVGLKLSQELVVKLLVDIRDVVKKQVVNSNQAVVRDPLRKLRA